MVNMRKYKKKKIDKQIVSKKQQKMQKLLLIEEMMILCIQKKPTRSLRMGYSDIDSGVAYWQNH